MWRRKREVTVHVNQPLKTPTAYAGTQTDLNYTDIRYI